MRTDPQIIPVEVLDGRRSDVVVVCHVPEAIDVSHAARAVLGRAAWVSTTDGVSAVRIPNVRLADGERVIDRVLRQREPDRE